MQKIEDPDGSRHARMIQSTMGVPASKGVLSVDDLERLDAAGFARARETVDAGPSAGGTGVGRTPVFPWDAEWPARLGDIPNPPVCLWLYGPRAEVRGRMVELFGRAVGVAGSRSATRYGLVTARAIGYQVAQAGATVVSGGAIGVDVTAHQGALVGGGSTVVVLAGDSAVAYPAAHEAFFADVVNRGGLVVSEWGPGVRPARERFLSRNRLISGLASEGVVIVEASRRSGSLNTARHANEQERRVWAVPGPITSVASEGCNDLIHQGWADILPSVDYLVDWIGGGCRG